MPDAGIGEFFALFAAEEATAAGAGAVAGAEAVGAEAAGGVAAGELAGAGGVAAGELAGAGGVAAGELAGAGAGLGAAADLSLTAGGVAGAEPALGTAAELGTTISAAPGVAPTVTPATGALTTPLEAIGTDASADILAAGAGDPLASASTEAGLPTGAQPTSLETAAQPLENIQRADWNISPPGDSTPITPTPVQTSQVAPGSIEQSLLNTQNVQPQPWNSAPTSSVPGVPPEGAPPANIPVELPAQAPQLGPPTNVSTPAQAQNLLEPGQGSPLGPGAQPTPATPAQPKPWGDRFVDTLTSPTTLLAAAPLALALARGQPKIPGQFRQVEGTGANLNAFADRQRALAESGQVNPGQQADLDIQRQNALNEARQQEFAMGRDPRADTQFQQRVAQIERQMEAQKGQMIQQMLTNSLSASGQASGDLIAAGNAQLQQDQNFTTALGDATKAFGTIMAFSALKKAA